jgi:hypothetical protein
MKTPAVGAFLEGWRRVLTAPAMIAAVLALTAAASLVGQGDLHRVWDPSGLRGLAGHPRSQWSPVHEGMLSAQIGEIGRAFCDQMLGIVHSWAAMAVWLAVAGGAIERLVQGRPIGATAFLRACRSHLFVFIRLAILTGSIYAGIVRWLAGDGLRLTLGVVIASFLATLTNVAAVRIATEHRRSATAALVNTIRFMSKRAPQMARLWLLNAMVCLVMLRLWYQAAPSPDTPAWTAETLRLGYVMAVRLTSMGALASTLVFFLGELRRPTCGPAPASIQA